MQTHELSIGFERYEDHVFLKLKGNRLVKPLTPEESVIGVNLCGSYSPMLGAG